MSLEPIDPETALELYLADRENSVTEATLYSHRSRLGHFVRWCKQEDISNLNELTGRQLNEYRLWRRREGELAPATEKTQMDTLRVFVRWLESVDGVEKDLHTKVRSPTMTGNDNIRDIMLEKERADEILEYLHTYEYASREHVTIALMYHTMMRVGAIYGLDCSDYDSEEQSLEVVHRPETGTPIKNAEEGERFIALSGEICGLLDDWLSHQRPEVTVDGRKPLISTTEGRAHKNTLRNDCYRFTRPCIIEGECPHDRNIDDCVATDYDKPFKCPSSVSPHALRRGSLTHALNQDWPIKAAGSRANVSETVLEQHYDQRTAQKKMEQRREYLDQL